MTAGARVVLCTVPSERVAETIARALVEERLVACVNIIPGIRSIYRWQDKVEDERELMLVMKTQAERYVDIERRVRALHPHEVCEVVALDAVSVSAPYLAWLFAETSLT
ncbi:MAG: CutA1 divalent ion tolerance protein [Myxococcaceae bacterium]|nr:CutA1 divalent ion tolerance protein [Myxococcaceae bacterium]